MSASNISTNYVENYKVPQPHNKNTTVHLFIHIMSAEVSCQLHQPSFAIQRTVIKCLLQAFHVPLCRLSCVIHLCLWTVSMFTEDFSVQFILRRSLVFLSSRASVWRFLLTVCSLNVSLLLLLLLFRGHVELARALATKSPVQAS